MLLLGEISATFIPLKLENVVDATCKPRVSKWDSCWFGDLLSCGKNIDVTFGVKMHDNITS